MEASTSAAQARWELENDVHSDDALLRFDQAEQTAFQQEAPWKKDPRHFRKCAHTLTTPQVQARPQLADIRPLAAA